MPVQVLLHDPYLYLAHVPAAPLASLEHSRHTPARMLRLFCTFLLYLWQWSLCLPSQIYTEALKGQIPHSKMQQLHNSHRLQVWLLYRQQDQDQCSHFTSDSLRVIQLCPFSSLASSYANIHCLMMFASELCSHPLMTLSAASNTFIASGLWVFF